MKTFSIYTHPDGRTIAIKHGWSWPAFLFTCFWALAKKLWLIGGIVIAASITLYIAIPSRPGHFSFSDLIEIAAMFFFGFKGNEWLQHDLVLRGFDYATTLDANTSEHAIGDYIRAQKTTA